MDEQSVMRILVRVLEEEGRATRGGGEATAAEGWPGEAAAARVLAAVEQLGCGPAAVERLQDELEFERAWGQERGRQLADAEAALERLRRGQELLREKLDAMELAYADAAGEDADGLGAARARAAAMERMSASEREAGRWRATAVELALALDALVAAWPADHSHPAVTAAEESLERHRRATG